MFQGGFSYSLQTSLVPTAPCDKDATAFTTEQGHVTESISVSKATLQKHAYALHLQTFCSGVSPAGTDSVVTPSHHKVKAQS